MKNVKKIVKGRDGLLIMAIALIVVIFTIINPLYLTPRNVVNIFEQSVVNGFLSVGITFAILLGGIDLSIGSIYAIVIVFVSKFSVAGMNPFLAIILGVLIGFILGAFNGILISKLKLQPFIATLGTMSVYRGFAYIVTNGNPIVGVPKTYRDIFNADVFEVVPVSIFFLIAFVIITHILLKKTKIGTHIYAVGGNEESAFLSGINVAKVKIIGYAMSGVGGALAGMVLLSQLGTGEPTAGNGAELNAIAATAIGGTSLAGGKGKPTSAFLGAVLLSALRVGLISSRVPTFWQFVATGAIIILATSVDFIQEKVKKLRLQ